MTKRLAVLGMALVALTLSGCVWSVHPLYTDETVVFEPGLVGVWATADGEKLAVVEQGGDKSYDITYQQKDLSEGASGKYSARLVRLGEYLFLDVYPDEKTVEDMMKLKPIWYLFPTHSFYRLKLDGDVLTVSLVNVGLIQETSEPPLAHEGRRAIDGYLLTASSAEMQAELKKRAGDESIYVKLGKFRRLK